MFFIDFTLTTFDDLHHLLSLIFYLTVITKFFVVPAVILGYFLCFGAKGMKKSLGITLRILSWMLFVYSG